MGVGLGFRLFSDRMFVQASQAACVWNFRAWIPGNRRLRLDGALVVRCRGAMRWRGSESPFPSPALQAVRILTEFVLVARTVWPDCYFLFLAVLCPGGMFSSAQFRITSATSRLFVP